ncbi:MAG: molybdate ABC transporter substrate-binding protein [Cyclobacteriaceae bacterium]|nr:molybdate ABC transporter substrate-binding protein [Cyclobacteriaceae bacterium]
MKINFFYLIALTLLMAVCAPKKAPKQQITIFCAASLAPAVEEIRHSWEKTHSEEIIVNAASSGTLARQIENGAEADIFLSASREWMEYIARAAQPGEPAKSIVGNSLVAIVPVGSAMDALNFDSPELADPGSGLIALADPGHVPLGKYTQEALAFYGLYEQWSEKATLTNDARSTLRLVELGEAVLGIVYLSDAKSSEKIKIVAHIPAKCHSQIAYEAVIIEHDNAAVRAFFNYLSGDATKSIWEKHGFLPLRKSIKSEGEFVK